MKDASSIFATSSTSQLALGGRNLSNIAINAPQLLSAPLYYTVYNTWPFDVPVYELFSNHCFSYGFMVSQTDNLILSAAVVDFVGLIYLLIIAIHSLFLIAIVFSSLTTKIDFVV